MQSQPHDRCLPGCLRRRMGLTLIELLAATALATLLMVAVLGVLKSITRGQKVLLAREPIESWQLRLTEQLRWDLENSRAFKPIAAGFQLEGFAGRDFSSSATTHARSVIEYVVVRAGDRGQLIRRESHPDSLQLHNSISELVCLDLERIVLGRPGEQASPVANRADFSGPPSPVATPPPTPQDRTTRTESPKSTVVDRPVDSQPLPDRVAVTLYRSGTSTPVFSHAFLVR